MAVAVGPARRPATARARRGPRPPLVSLLQLRAQQVLVDRVLAAARAFLLLGDRPLRGQASKTGRRAEGAGACILCAEGAGAYLVYFAHGARGGVLQPLLLHLLRARVARVGSSAGAEASSERSLERTLSRSVSVWGTSTALHASATFSLT